MTFSLFKLGIITSLVSLSLVACNAPKNAETPSLSETAIKIPTQRNFTADQFTYSNYQDIKLTHVSLDLDVNFDRKVLDGTATLSFERVKPETTSLILDTKDLLIKAVAVKSDAGWKPTDYTLSNYDAVQGSAMQIDVGTATNTVRIVYETSPQAEGLQWLTPAQTAGKKKPYLFSQAQAINARTMIPLQDTPAVRMTYDASLRVPDGLLPLMSASQDGQQEDGSWSFNMPQPIPSYLIAIAVGDIKFKAINDTIGVYAEEYILEASAEEFAETPEMEVANTELYGPYRWGRYDLIVLPPSFPYGGMENPRLSFMTPVENRVMEELYGEERAVMEQVLGLEDLKRDVANAARPSLTQLKFTDDLQHPDEAFSQVTYVKGQFFLNFLEDRFGRAAFDPFLKAYFNAYAFDSITTRLEILNLMPSIKLRRHLKAGSPVR